MRGLLAAALLVSVVAANVATDRLGLVAAAPGLLVTAGTWFAGLALLLRDGLDRAGGLRWVLPTIAGGALLSAVLASPALALASAVAFTVGELVDLAVFRSLRRRSMAAAIAGSNAAGAAVDALIFLPLAGFPLTAAAVGGQFLVKAVWLTAAVFLVLAVIRAVPRQRLVPGRA